jgi:hypothetical protein
MIVSNKFSLVKPTVDTPFHIDFDWWKQHDSNWKVYLHSCLCTDHQAAFENLDYGLFIDYIDPDSAEIHTVDGLQHTLITHCSKISGFITIHTTLVDTVFRTFLANGNSSMTPNQLGEQINRLPGTILRTLAGATIYKGIRPCIMS